MSYKEGLLLRFWFSFEKSFLAFISLSIMFLCSMLKQKSRLYKFLVANSTFQFEAIIMSSNMINTLGFRFIPFLTKPASKRFLVSMVS